MGLMQDKIAGIICMGVGILTLLGTKGLPIMSKGTGFGPGAFPLLVGGGLTILSFFLVLKSSFFKEEAGQKVEFSKMFYKPFLVLLFTGSFIGLVFFLGFLVSTILFVFVVTRIFGEKSIWINVLFSVSLGLITYAVFAMFLSLPLPKGYVLSMFGVV